MTDSPTVNRNDRVMVKVNPQESKDQSNTLQLAEHFRNELTKVKEKNKSPLDLQRDRAIYQPRGSQ